MAWVQVRLEWLTEHDPRLFLGQSTGREHGVKVRPRVKLFDYKIHQVQLAIDGPWQVSTQQPVAFLDSELFHLRLEGAASKLSPQNASREEHTHREVGPQS